VLYGGDPVFWLEDFADEVGSAVYVATRWSSTTRRLVHRTTHPVLVLPDRARASRQPVGSPQRT
jgi:hypothetical protein